MGSTTSVLCLTKAGLKKVGPCRSLACQCDEVADEPFLLHCETDCAQLVPRVGWTAEAHEQLGADGPPGHTADTLDHTVGGLDQRRVDDALAADVEHGETTLGRHPVEADDRRMESCRVLGPISLPSGDGKEADLEAFAHRKP